MLQIPEVFLEQLDEMIETDEVSIDEFMSVFVPFMKNQIPTSSLNDSRTSQNSQGNSNDSSISVFNDENGIPESELMKAPQEGFIEPNSIAYSVGTYSGNDRHGCFYSFKQYMYLQNCLAYGDSPMKPLRESTSTNSIKAQNEKEIEALRKKILYQSTEYDKLLEKLNSSEHECKSYQTTIENLEVSGELSYTVYDILPIHGNIVDNDAIKF